jgi:thiol-disulfide isomerase/thioredoxin
MKKIVYSVVLLLMVHVAAKAQTQYEVQKDADGSKILKGIIAKELLSGDSSFSWYAPNLSGYTPNAEAVEGLRKNAGTIHIIAFMGTWCDDSRNIIPKFYRLLEAGGFPLSRVTLFGVDRQKKTLSDVADALGITNVPTILVMKNGKEQGRVVEYGKYGLFDKELAEIINGIK